MVKSMNEKHDENHLLVSNSLSRIELALDTTNKKLDYTNGKIRKIIMAMIGLGGILIGLGFKELSPFLTALL